MAKRDTIIIDGRAYSWQQICDLRRRQIEARRLAQPQQLALFELRVDSRPEPERTASGRYEQPTMLELMRSERDHGPRC
jgi:hypothetical protein